MTSPARDHRPGPPLAEFHLRPPTAGDRDLVLDAHRRSLDLHRGWGTGMETDQDYDDWLGRIDPERNHTQLAFHRDELIGFVNLQNIVRGHGQFATLGYAGFAPHAGRGLLRRAVALGIDEAFGPMELHRVEAGIMPRNGRSIALVRALGFQCEGVLRKLVRIEDAWEDHELWSLLTDEWPGASSLFE